jgi:hypothetical protein
MLYGKVLKDKLQAAPGILRSSAQTQLRARRSSEGALRYRTGVGQKYTYNSSRHLVEPELGQALSKPAATAIVELRGSRWRYCSIREGVRPACLEVKVFTGNMGKRRGRKKKRGGRRCSRRPFVFPRFRQRPLTLADANPPPV